MSMPGSPTSAPGSDPSMPGSDLPGSPTRMPGPDWRHPSSWTLRAKIVASMLALFSVITVVTAAAFVVSLSSFLTGQIDDQLRSSLTQLTGRTPNPTPPPVQPSDDRRGPGEEGIVVIIQNGVPYSMSRTDVTYEQAAQLQDAGLGSKPQDIDLGGELGPYRVLAGSRPSTSGTTTVIVGLPRARQENTIGNTVRTAVLAAGLGLLAVGVGGAWLVKRNLRPLTRVVATATRVSEQDLTTGKVALAERVPPEDTDRRTEVGQVGAALNELLDTVDNALNARHQSEQQVRRFVADASHELRTPLASIRGYAELTRRETEPVPASVTHALGRVESEAMRMSSLVDDLLLLARLDSGRPLENRDVDLSEMVVNAVSDAHAASPSHTWSLDVPGDPVVIHGDGARLHQLVSNLLANARVHTGPGTTVKTSLAREDGHVRLVVHDNGPGVPVELQQSVFQRFARGDGSRNRAAGSTGLGLSIVAAVAHAHGGTVELASTPGDTTFTVLLPAGERPHPADLAAP
ncbi:MAG: HAMP domain-containing sensor histidine kinase [Dermatophilaceae bacterium]